MILNPTESAICGISLRSFVQGLVTFDVLYAFLGLGAVAGSFLIATTQVAQFQTVLNLVLVLVVGFGAVLGILGLNINNAEKLNQYAMTRFVRIAISVLLTAAALSHASETATSQVDAFIAQSGKKSEITEDERNAMIRQFTAALVAGLLTWELVTDAFSLYFAYVTASLAEFTKVGGVTPVPAAAPLLAGV
jgi:hypothetical protein